MNQSRLSLFLNNRVMTMTSGSLITPNVHAQNDWMVTCTVVLESFVHKTKGLSPTSPPESWHESYLAILPNLYQIEGN